MFSKEVACHTHELWESIPSTIHKYQDLILSVTISNNTKQSLKSLMNYEDSSIGVSASPFCSSEMPSARKLTLFTSTGSLILTRSSTGSKIYECEHYERTGFAGTRSECTDRQQSDFSIAKINYSEFGLVVVGREHHMANRLL